MVMFSDAKKSFTLSQDYENLKTVDGLIMQARIFIREIKSLIGQYAPSHKPSSREGLD